MPVTEADTTTAPQRHGIYMPARGTFVAAGRDRDISRMPDPDIRFGIGLWPSELMAYIEADDAFTNAAVRLRQLGPKLVAALQEMQTPLEDLKNRTVGAIEEELTLELVERTPLRVDLVAQYIAELLDHVATVVPGCYGSNGRPLLDDRGSLRRLAAGPLSDVNPQLAEIVAPGGILPDWAETLAASAIGEQSDFSALPLANDPNLYIIVNHPNFGRADADQKLAALKASATQTIAAAEAIDASMLGMFRWLDRLLDHLIGVVCVRLPEGDQLRERWASDDWTTIQRLTFFDTDAALAITRAFPAISEGPLLPGTESE
ncbi:MAG: hypothetical protein OXS30_11770 [Chloroflexota bacterium]|nr:hypothetical protein [Chloroflexota bacterium]